MKTLLPFVLAVAGCSPGGRAELDAGHTAVEACDDHTDNDGDAKTDCADPDCFSSPACCLDLCTQGAALCDQAGLRTCQLDPQTGCLRFGAPVACATPLVCSGGLCADTCTDQCTSGARICASTGSVVECQTTSSGCTDWVEKDRCASGQTCGAGACLNAGACTDACPLNATRCTVAGQQQTCIRPTAGCTDWGFPTPAAACAVVDAGPDAGPSAGTDAGTDAGTAPDAGTWTCSVDKWCSPASMPQSHTLLGIWGSSASDIWAVGESGTTLHWNGAQWAAVPSGTSQTLTAVWGSAATDVWAVGGAGTLLHWTGSAWASVTSPTTLNLNGVWGSSAGDVWAVGANGTLLHWNGTAWSAVSSGTTLALNGVWGASATDVWVVGYFGIARHWNGTSWTTFTTPTDGFNHYPITLNSIRGLGTNQIWAVGTDNSFQIQQVLRWDGMMWIREPSASRNLGMLGWLSGVWPTSATDAWAVGSDDTTFGLLPVLISHWDGTAWKQVDSGLPNTFRFGAIWASSPTDLWVVGSAGAVLHHVP